MHKRELQQVLSRGERSGRDGDMIAGPEAPCWAVARLPRARDGPFAGDAPPRPTTPGRATCMHSISLFTTARGTFAYLLKLKRTGGFRSRSEETFHIVSLVVCPALSLAAAN
ncbi:hypothetical protein MRX96_055883 [Rhipicephalus microplus]